MTATQPGFFRDLLSDDHGHWDIGFVGMFVLIIMILGVIPLMCTAMIIKFFVLPGYPFDVLTLGQAVALIAGAFTGPLAGLAAYILAMKRPAGTVIERASSSSIETTASVDPKTGGAP